MRVLHLIDASSPQATATTLALMAQSLGRLGDTDQHVFLLGGRGLKDAADAAGLHPASVLGTPFGKAVLGWPKVNRSIKNLGRIDLVHCWSIGALSLTAIKLRTIPRVLTLTTVPTPRSVRWLRMVLRETQGQTVLLSISSTIRRGLLGGGLPESTVHVLRPAIDMGMVDHDSRSTLRRQWGVRGDKTKIIALLGDTAHDADALAASKALNMVADSSAMDGLDPRLLVRHDQINRQRIETVMRHLHKQYRIIQEPRMACPWSVLPGCDLAVALSANGGGLSLLWAMAANVPIIAEATYAASEIVEDRHSALMVQPGSPKSIAQRIVTLVRDPQLTWQLRDTARHEAFSYFSRQNYCQSLQTVYDQIVGGHDVEIPLMESTGGLRFSGRG